MHMERRWSMVGLAMMGSAALAVGCGADGSTAGSDSPSLETSAGALCGAGGLDASTKFFVPPPADGPVQQVASLLKAHKLADAVRLTAMSLTPQAVWFT